MDRTINSGANLCQKIGYCCQRLKDYEGAVEFYQQAEIFDPNNRWTLKKQACCYRILRQWEKALNTYRKLNTLQPDNISILTQIGYCLIELQRWNEALDYMARVVYSLPDDVKICRAVVWTAFRSSDFPRAEKFAGRVLEMEGVLWQDFLTLGHILWAQNRLTKALEAYSSAVRLADGNYTIVEDALRFDASVLSEVGIDISDLPIVLDSLHGIEM